MGGRGVFVSDDNSQIKMTEYLRSLEIKNIRENWDDYRAKNYHGIGGAGGAQMMRKKCACCLQYTLLAFTEYEQCPVCGWIDDPEQNRNSTSRSGLNPISLQEARQKWVEQQAKDHEGQK